MSEADPAPIKKSRHRPLAAGVGSLAWMSLSVAVALVQAGDPAPTIADGPDLIVQRLARLPPLGPPPAKAVADDWLIASTHRSAGVFRGEKTNELILDNGLIRRTFRVAPNGATVGFESLVEHKSLLRGVKPEALISLDGQEFAVGGLVGQPEYAYLVPAWVDRLRTDPAAFQCTGFQVTHLTPSLTWNRKRHAAVASWPPSGVALTFSYSPPSGRYPGLVVLVHYELYEGIPAMCKWLEVVNGTTDTVTLDTFTSEMLAVVEAESAVDERHPGDWLLPGLYLQSDFSFAGMDLMTAKRAVEWLPDPQFTSQVNYNLKTPCLAVSRAPLGPDQRIPPGGRFASFRTYELAFDGDGRERQGLAIRRLLRTVAPWATENPIMMHVRSADTRVFRNAVDQCAAVGFEMIIYTFGSGLDMENQDPAYLAKVKADVDYAHSKGIEVGAYSLLASRRVSDADDVISPKSGKPDDGAVFGNSPCLGSRWGQEYFRRITNFIEQTGLDLLEHDGSYPGDVCASTQHPGHRGLLDSQWNQWRTISDLYRWCRARGVYLNVPDYYFLVGSSKTGMGYRESNWSLPRERQLILGRQNIFDGTWEKTPSMGWMFVPLVEYQGGGAAATLEPLHEHLEAYSAHLANNFGAGVQACYRGPRLYDTQETKRVLKRWVDWFKQHRDILESDIIHVRRADGRDLDCLLHVNPQLKEKGLAMVYNPLPTAATRVVKLTLYFTGLTRTAKIREQEGSSRRYELDRQYQVEIPIHVPAGGVTWLVIE